MKIDKIVEDIHSITLKKRKEGYDWEIKLYFNDLKDSALIVNKLKEVDSKLKSNFRNKV